MLLLLLSSSLLSLPNLELLLAGVFVGLHDGGVFVLLQSGWLYHRKGSLLPRLGHGQPIPALLGRQKIVVVIIIVIVVIVVIDNNSLCKRRKLGLVRAGTKAEFDQLGFVVLGQLFEVLKWLEGSFVDFGVAERTAIVGRL